MKNFTEENKLRRDEIQVCILGIFAFLLISSIIVVSTRFSSSKSIVVENNTTTTQLKSVVYETKVIYKEIPVKTEVISYNFIDIETDKLKTTAYKELKVPNDATGTFKTFMGYHTITDKTSDQWNLQQLAETNREGFRIFNGKYLVAIGTYYTTEIGKEFRITLDTGKTFNVIIGDIKDDAHTDSYHQYIPANGNIIEFIVDTTVLSKEIKKLGDISSLGLEGDIIRIEEVIYNE